jgi:biopolymer transport protein ExbB/TolQ
MKALVDLVSRGGPVMFAIIALSVILYSRCFMLLLTLRRSRLQLSGGAPVLAEEFEALRRLQDETQDGFRQQRLALGAMIAAAPLLGLLGTVSGLVRTFESLSAQKGQSSMEGLAAGISQVLVTTESGLVVAIPALLIVYLAHREMRKQLQKMNQLEERAETAPAP